MTPAVELTTITKRYGAVTANDGVTLSVASREVHAIVGENGAGKSTLMKILYGLVQPDEGSIALRGTPLPRHTPADAFQLGIGMVHQHFMLVPTLSVAENIVLGMEPRSGLFVDAKAAEARVRKLSEIFGLRIDPAARVAELSVGEQQRVEILKALHRGAEILILDEPTAVLTPGETDELFAIVRRLAANGRTIILITHKLDEVMRVSDRVTVMKTGRVVGTIETKATNPPELARMMVGRDVLLEVAKSAAAPQGGEVLSVEHLTVTRRNGTSALEDVGFSIRAGEILGIAGVEGNGQSELIEAIMGLNADLKRSGSIRLLGREISSASARDRLDAGTSHIPEDRLRRGLVADFTVAENLALGQQAAFSRGGFLDRDRFARHADAMIERFDIRPADSSAAVATLSGGNQQKLIVAREFHRDFRLLVAAQPTRGVDIGAIEFIHARILEARASGRAVLLVSAELSELLMLADRVAVLFRGRIVCILDAATEEELGVLMTGAAA